MRLPHLATGVALSLSLSLLASCAFHVGTNCPSCGLYTVDGVTLRESHVETLMVDSLPPEGFAFDLGMGSVLFEPSASRSEIEVELMEATPGDASAHLEGGRLELRTKSGKPAAVKRIHGRIAGELASLTVETGMGDVEVRDLEIAGRVDLESGAGDVRLRGGRSGACELSTGMGDVQAQSYHCDTLAAETGMGDVDVTELVASRGTFHTGMGDVSVKRSTVSSIDAESGLGDVELVATACETHSLDSGLGDVEIRD